MKQDKCQSDLTLLKRFVQEEFGAIKDILPAVQYSLVGHQSEIEKNDRLNRREYNLVLQVKKKK